MLTVDDYGAIRRARRDGKSIRRIAREFDHSRNTIRKVLNYPEPSSRPEIETHRCWGRFTVIDQILPTTRLLRPSSGIPRLRFFVASVTSTDTAAVMPRYNVICSSTTTRRRKPSSPWAIFRANASRPISVISTSIFPTAGGVPFLVTTWAYSNSPFVVALPFERTEAILEGMVRAFEFFGSVSKEVWWDNPKTVAT